MSDLGPAHIDTTQMHNSQPEADALVLFGATGDLAKRKLFPALYQLEKSGALHVPVIGVARSDWTDDDFREPRPRVDRRARSPTRTPTWSTRCAPASI